MRIIFWSLLFLSSLSLWAQDEPNKWDISLDLGNYNASLAVPSFQTFHPGGRLGLHYQWNNHPHHQWRQSAYLGYFNHSLYQQAIQVYTETAYEWQLENGLYIRPLSVGGGYLMSIGSFPTLDWDEETQTYVENNTPIRNQWMISLGSELGYQFNLGPKPTVYVAYRLLVHGIVVQSTVPLIAYSPLMIGLRMPLAKR